jgi:hypothetical protein
VQRAALHPSRLTGFQPAEVPPAGRTLHGIELSFGVEQALRRPGVLGHEGGRGQLEVFAHTAMERAEVRFVLAGEREAAFRLAGRRVRQTALDDVSGVTQVDGEVEHMAVALSICF